MAETISDIIAKLGEQQGPQLVDPESVASARPAVHSQSGFTEKSQRLTESIDDIMLKLSGSELDESAAIEQARRRSVTHQPISATQAPGSIDLSGPENTQSTIADKSTRVGLARDLQTIGRVGLEVGGGLGGLGIGRRVAGPILKRFGPRAARNLEALTTGAGEAAGSLAAETFDPSGDPIRTARDAALTAGLADRFASGNTAVASRVRRGGTRLTAGARPTIEALGEGNLPSSSRLSENALVDFQENVIENSIGSTGVITRRNERAALEAVRQMRAIADDMVAGASRAEIDQLAMDLVSDQTQVFKETARTLYAGVDGVAPQGVSTAATIEARNKLVRAGQKGGFSTGLNSVVEAIDRTLGVPTELSGIKPNHMISTEVVRRPMRKGDPGFNPAFSRQDVIDAREAPEFMPFADAAVLRSDLLTIGRDNSDVFASKVGGNADGLGGIIDTSMAEAAESLTPEAFKMWRDANRFWKDGADAFGASIMQSLANAKPDEVLKMVLREDSPEQIRRFRKLVFGGTGGTEDTAEGISKRSIATLRDSRSSKEAKAIARARLSNIQSAQLGWQKMKGQLIINILNKADPAAGLSEEAAQGTRVLAGSRALDRFRALGDDTIKELFSGSERKKVETLLGALDVSQAGSGLGTGRLGAQFIQMGALGKMLMFSPDLGSLAIVMGPAIMAKLFDNEKFIRWVTLGNKTKPGSRLRLRAATQMALIASREGARIRGSDGELLSDFNQGKHARNVREFSSSARARGDR